MSVDGQNLHRRTPSAGRLVRGKHSATLPFRPPRPPIAPATRQVPVIHAGHCIERVDAGRQWKLTKVPALYSDPALISVVLDRERPSASHAGRRRERLQQNRFVPAGSPHGVHPRISAQVNGKAHRFPLGMRDHDLAYSARRSTFNQRHASPTLRFPIPSMQSDVASTLRMRSTAGPISPSGPPIRCRRRHRHASWTTAGFNPLTVSLSTRPPKTQSPERSSMRE